MPEATLRSDGRITIPTTVREALHLAAGERVHFLVRDDGVVELRPQNVDLRDLYGMLADPHHRTLTTEATEHAIAKAVVEEFDASARR